MKKTFYPLILSVLFLNTVAQAQDYKNGVTYKWTKFDYSTPVTRHQADFVDMTNGVEIGYTRNLAKGLNLHIPLRMASVNVPGKATNRSLFGADAVLQLQWFKAKNLIVPYLLGGLSAYKVDKTINWAAPIGAGLNFKLGDGAYLNLESSYRTPLENTVNKNWQHALGLLFNFPATDDNKMTVEEPKMDKTAEMAAAKAKMEAEAKAKMEAEARLAAEAKAKIEAEAEAMANKARMEAEAMANKAKMEAEAMANKTRMEAEAKMAAEEKAKRDAANANKDSDGDGVMDNIDKCPNTFGSKANNGCPVVVTEEAKVVMAQALSGVQFDLGKATFQSVSYGLLDNVVAVMQQHPEYSLSIQGYTDNTGNAAANQSLSETRAKACYSYLVSKGIAATRLNYAGLGSANPVGDNKTAEGRKMNRRVEFIVR